MEEISHQIINYIASVFDVMGIAIVVWGGIKSTLLLIHKEYKKDKIYKKRRKLNDLRFDFGYALVLALEYFLAGDVIRTAISPSWDHLGKLGALVVIRTTLSYFLRKELTVKE